MDRMNSPVRLPFFGRKLSCPVFMTIKAKIMATRFLNSAFSKTGILSPVSLIAVDMMEKPSASRRTQVTPF